MLNPFFIDRLCKSPSLQSVLVNIRLMKVRFKGSKISTFFFSAFAVLICIFNFNQQNFFTPTDIEVWLPDFLALKGCLQDQGSISSCSALSKFPLAYLGESAVLSTMAQLKISLALGTSLLNAFFSLVAFALLVPILPGIRNGLNLVKICIVILLTPLPWFYFQSGAIEYQSGLLLAIVSASFGFLVRRNGIYAALTTKQTYAGILLFASSFLFGLYKDTQSILLISSLLISLLLFQFLFGKHLRISFSAACVLLSGCLTSTIASLSYNFYRYNDILPRNYLHEAIHRTPDVQQKFFNLLGIWFSPSGGVVSFWGLSIIYISTVVSYRAFKRPEVVLTSSFLLLSSIALASWWSPFGWFSWGNRLIIPSVMGFLFSLLLSSFDRRDTALEELILLKLANSSKWNPLKWLLSTSLALTIACSSYYLIRPAFISTRAKVFYEYHNSSPECQAWLHQDQNSKSGDAFWRSRTYYDCVSSRFWQPIQSW